METIFFFSLFSCCLKEPASYLWDVENTLPRSQGAWNPMTLICDGTWSWRRRLYAARSSTQSLFSKSSLFFLQLLAGTGSFPFSRPLSITGWSAACARCCWPSSPRSLSVLWPPSFYLLPLFFASPSAPLGTPSCFKWWWSATRECPARMIGWLAASPAPAWRPTTSTKRAPTRCCCRCWRCWSAKNWTSGTPASGSSSTSQPSASCELEAVVRGIAVRFELWVMLRGNVRLM